MRKFGVAIVGLALLAATALPRRAQATDKHILAIEQSVNLLLSEMHDLQKSFNTQFGMMQGLVTQNTDTVNKLSAALTAIQHTLNGNQLVAAQHQTDIGKQFQALSDAIAAAQAQLQKMNETLQQVHQLQQTVPAAAVAAPVSTSGAPGAVPGAAPGVTPGLSPNPANPNFATGAPATAAPAPPSPLQLYQQALSDFKSGSPAAQGELASFIRTYPNNPQVPDATYFLGSIFYQNGQYNEAIDQFNQLIEMYPDNDKTPLAELSKGVSLAKQGNKLAAISELRALSKNHPGTEAARQADIELRKLEPRRPR